MDLQRVTHTLPTENDFLMLFANPVLLKTGGGLNDINSFKSPIYYQKGSGLLSWIKGIAKKNIPFALKYVMPEALAFGQSVLNDLERDNGSLKTTLKRRGLQSLTNVGRRVAKGGNIKRKRRRLTKKRKPRKCYKTDVFASNLPVQPCPAVTICPKLGALCPLTLLELPRCFLDHIVTAN